ncbi:ABC transporter substrate-binding protein [Paenibacillus sp. CF384]|uniref:ABC transporter substrate-binding protein n=1 Tax=Paenibacillus sp. CF384 TaxID=1884382 RepID=UPI000894B1B8|nr:ABC transporter substrate-binding protein [Paenibacillus sp. CF384]SDX07536.1 hypothetical protein SAMN05518855_1008174 [Paenibacillus sp. CF384]
MSTSHYLSCYPLSIKLIHFKRSFRSEPMHAGSGLIVIVQGGSGQLFLRNGISSAIKEGVFFFFHPGEGSFELMTDSIGTLKVALITYSALHIGETETVGGKLPSITGNGTIHRAASALTESQLSLLHQAMTEESEIGMLRRQHAFLELLLHLHAHQQAPDRIGHDSIQTTIDYMEQRLSKPFQISELYDRLGFLSDDRVTHGSYMDHAFDRVVELDPEQILVIWSDDASIHEFAADSRWQQLSAVKGNRVYFPDSLEWDPWGPIGREYMIKAMVRFFCRL